MKRVLLLIPEGLTFDQLTAAQQAAINNIFGQYVMPMPHTIAVDGLIICDAVCADSFDPAHMPLLGLTWEIIGLWQWDGHTDALTELVPLDETKLLERTAPSYDEQGEPLPIVLHETHKWAGWPDMIV